MTDTALRVLFRVADWAEAIVALPVAGPLPARTVLVPNERVAHVLRRLLVQRGDRAALVGTRFFSPLQLARYLLHAAGEPASVHDLRLTSVFTRRALETLTLAYFRADQLLRTPGWDSAIARTLVALDAADVAPAELLGSDDAQTRDVGRIYAALRSRGELATPGALFRQAVGFAGAARGLGPVLAVVTGFESASEAVFLTALGDVQLMRWATRPRRPQLEARIRTLFGERTWTDHRACVPRPASQTRLETLQFNLWTEPHAPMDDDGTVRIVTYAGVHEEVEAAVAWVAERLLEGVEAGNLAILAPNLTVYGPLLRARLSSLPWPDAPDAVYVERGVPAVELVDGQRTLLVLRALTHGLCRDALATLLPLFRLPFTQYGGIGGHARAWELLNTVACVGGERSHPGGGVAWDGAWEAAIARLTQPAEHGAGPELRERERREGMREQLRQLSPAIYALTGLLRRVLANAALDELLAALGVFLEAHVRASVAGPVWMLLASAADAFAERDGAAPRGASAVAFLERTLCEATVQPARFGEPRVYVGTLSGARGLSFRAVRVVGLVEGALPSATREDPVLPDAARAALSALLPTSRQRAHRELAAFDDAVRAARETLVLSAPRVSTERSVRRPAAVLLDVIGALGRVDKTRSLEQALDEAARMGRQVERALGEELAISPAARLDRIARGDRALAAERSGAALSVERVCAIQERTHATEQDGLLAQVFPRESLPGLTRERPISASRLQTLLGCPHQYLYDTLLGFRAPEAPLPTDVLPANTFGTWLHGIAETFWREHGAELARREGALATHRAALRRCTEARFADLRASYPFANEEVADAQCDALYDQLEKLLLHDWEAGVARTFIDVERAFGYVTPCALDVQPAPLFLRGKIDKLDAEDGTLLVRDIKTGSGKPRRGDAPPDPSIDLQLGVYAQVAEALADSWGTSREVAVAYLYLRRGELERTWRGADYARLSQHTRAWLETAVETLLEGAFVRTANRADCRFCPYQAVCAPELERVEAALADPRVPSRLAALKRGGPG